MNWISVEKDLPPADKNSNLQVESGNVLIYGGVFGQVDIGFYAYDTQSWYYSDGNLTSLTDEYVTHWQPLPETPQV
jgi:hypothetical protein